MPEQSTQDIIEKEEVVSYLASHLNIPPLIVEILWKRGINTLEDLKQFLFPSADKLFSPWRFSEMERAIKRIETALEKKEQIWIYGDYDVDGITSIALLVYTFRLLGKKVNYYIPHRVTEGYGLHREALEQIIEKGGKLIITVDCGITSCAEVEWGNKRGLEFIITDHHLPREQLPDAYAIINPTIGEYPFPYLAGVGVAFKLAQVLAGGFEKLEEHLDLVALGTVADVVPLLGENRILASLGIKQMAKTFKPGLKALLKVASIKEIKGRSIGFHLGPRINAIGRLGDARVALELLLEEDIYRAEELANFADYQNKLRQRLCEEILKEIKEKISDELSLPIVIGSPNWHIGVLGLVAGRIAEEYSLPTYLIWFNGEEAKGTARSVGEFSIFDSMAFSKDLLIQFGGHRKAGGFSLLKKNFYAFKSSIEEYFFQNKDKAKVELEEKVDVEISFFDITPQLVEWIEKLEPFGEGNPSPLFLWRNVKVSDFNRVGKDGKHCRLLLEQGGLIFFGIIYNYNGEEIEKDILVDIIGVPIFNYYEGIEQIEIRIEKIKKSLSSLTSSDKYSTPVLHLPKEIKGEIRCQTFRQLKGYLKLFVDKVVNGELPNLLFIHPFILEANLHRDYLKDTLPDYIRVEDFSFPIQTPSKDQIIGVVSLTFAISYLSFLSSFFNGVVLIDDFSRQLNIDYKLLESHFQNFWRLSLTKTFITTVYLQKLEEPYLLKFSPDKIIYGKGNKSGVGIERNFYSLQYSFSPNIPFSREILLMELPTSVNEFLLLLSPDTTVKSYIREIYPDRFLSIVFSREELIKYYKKLLQYLPVSIEEVMNKENEKLKKALCIFKEIGVLERDENLLKLARLKDKKDLNLSPTFKEGVAQLNQFNYFCKLLKERENLQKLMDFWKIRFISLY